MGKVTADSPTAADWIFYCYQNLPEEVLKKVFVTAWYVWYNRNLIAHGGRGYDPISAAIRLKSLLKAFKNCHSFLTPLLQSKDESWNCPPVGSLKINTDGSFTSGRDPGGAAGVIRNSSGEVIEVFAFQISNCRSGLDAEGQALVHAMNLAYDNKWEDVIFETDSSELAELVLFNKGIGEGFHWCRTAQSWLANKCKWRISLISRKANGTADLLAKKARQSGWSWSMSMAIPICILGTL